MIENEKYDIFIAYHGDKSTGSESSAREIYEYLKGKEIYQGRAKQRQSVMVSEGNSIQSAPAIEDIGVINNQMGKSFDYADLIELM